MSHVIVKASTVITVDAERPRAEAVAVDTETGVIIAVGTLADCQGASPDATVTDLGSSVLLPGFIDSHNHPGLSGLVTQAPAYWIAPYVGYPSFADVETLFHKANAEEPAGQPLLFNGLDRMLQGAPELDRVQLDAYFPDRAVIVFDNSGHEVYFNSGVIAALGWPNGTPPADPAGASFGRNEDGSSNGLAYESTAIAQVLMPMLPKIVSHPLHSCAQWYALMARHGVTATSDHSYSDESKPIFEALASTSDCPIRISLYHVSTESTCGEPFSSPVPDNMLRKQGIKLWADGAPWVGTIAISFPYLDTATTRNAQIVPGATYETKMNYSRAQLDATLASNADKGFQFAFHVNGDVALDIVLDAYERALDVNGLTGTDHRWRVEHLGACRGDQFERAANLGVVLSMGPYQLIYWGDLLDGEIFDSKIGAQWQRIGDAFRAGAVVAFHNDGMVSPPDVLLNIQTVITRRTPSGQLHGAEQIISLDDAIKAQTINAAHVLHRDHEIGSIEVGKLADFTVLSRDPYEVEASRLTTDVAVEGTWVGGKPIDLDVFLEQVRATDPTEHHAAIAGVSAGIHRC
ncbi:amidohydrolase [Rhodococcus sp. PAMC28707]|uniref:amidohydrolase n=1 Tax=unclassified Rhodococcus (in: high G+C Gram-positive bacteria) TaxID=192944 RepID=UPI00109E25F5|nr:MULTISPECIES: amidohydrolase [unclassified Rhodococcus (in: high G+C Gram-positive bacteria)]QCB49639.1 amidohydrolase [Rhodococcus sp. PAMC28705]QCB58670.1 amidohydrolase [Rhodococcus sp. PAMC28707]